MLRLSIAGVAVAAALLLGPDRGRAQEATKQDKPAESAGPNTLTAREIADGWILLFDGETTFGWRVQGDVKVDGGRLVVGGPKETTIETTVMPADFTVCFNYAGDAADKVQVVVRNRNIGLMGAANGNSRLRGYVSVDGTRMRAGFQGTADFKAGTDMGVDLSPLNDRSVSKIAFRTPAGVQAAFDSIKVQPLNTLPLFNGKDLSGWKEFPGKKSVFSVTDKGEINVKNGPGDLQTVGKYDDFILQLECISHGKALNSGIFFRCIEGQYQNGYEAQIQNGYKDGDRTKPADFGTGAVYRRVPARKVVSDDGEWFTMTVIARGNHIATWVNGYQTVDWTDTRPPHENPRNGYRAEKGHISIQGHDPTTNLSFRNLRIAELPRKK